MISIINDFIKADDIKKLLTLIGKAKPKDLDHEVPNHKNYTPSKILDENNNSEIFSLVNSYIDSIHREINTVFSIDVHKETDYSVVVYSEGEYLHPHFDAMTDKYHENRTPNGHESRDISSVLYLNDDYLGGVLGFPFLNLSIKPPAGCLVIFPSSEKYTHLVDPIEKGLRYIVPQFWCIK